MNTNRETFTLETNKPTVTITITLNQVSNISDASLSTTSKFSSFLQNQSEQIY